LDLNSNFLELESKLELGFFYRWKPEDKTRLKFQVLTLNKLLSSCVLRPPRVFEPFSSSYTKNQLEKYSFKNEHLYTCVVSNLNSLLNETLKKGK
jgi:hypothetical protein